MARRDVDLVIRAKDEAAKAVDAITAAIEGLVNSQADLSKQSGKTESVLAGLGTALAGLDRALRGQSGAERLTRELDRATAAMQAQQQSISRTQGELDRLQTELDRTRDTTTRLRSEMEKLEGSLNAQKAVLASSKQAHAALSKELRDATTERDRLARTETRLTAAITAQQAKVDAARAKYQALSQEVAQTAEPTKRLQNSLESANKALDRQTTKLQTMEAGLAEARAGLAQTTADVAQFNTRLEASATSVEKQGAAIRSGAEDLAQLRLAVRASAREQDSLETSLDRAASSLDAQQQALTRSQAGMEKLAQSSAEAEAAISKLAQEARGPLLQAYRLQQSVVSQINNTYQANRKELAALSQEMSRVGVPTREMVETYNRLNQVSREIQTEYAQQQGALRTLGAALKETATDTRQLQQTQNLFASTIAQSTNALGRLQAGAAQAAASNARIAASARQAAQSQREASSAMQQAGSAASSAASSSSRLAQAYREIYGESRQAMSWTQRLRGEVLALVTSYAGLFGVIELLNQTVQAFQTLEAATSRLGAVFEGDENRVGQELDFIRRNADRLGIEFGALADEYTKFAAATKNTNLEGAETRRIFIAVAEAARVNKLSFDDLQGVFRALTQIASKGKVQLEELTGQLGDRLPGALQIMADGLGVTTEELLAMTKEGEVTSDALSGFADELQRRFGPQLGKSLETTTTYMGQLKNAVFQALLQFGQSGFIEGFNSLLLKTIDTINSADFQSFAANASAAFGVLAETLGLAIENFQLLTAAAAAFVGIRVAPAVLTLGKDFVDFSRGIAAAATAQTAASAAIGASAAPIGVATAALGGLRAALVGLMSSTGVGIVLAAIGAGIALWATEADTATEALVEHRKIVDAVKNEYDKAGKSVENWAEQIKTTSAREAAANLDRLRQGAADVRKEFEVSGASSGIGRLRPGTAEREIAQALQDLQQQFIKTGGNVDEYRAKIEALANQTEDARVNAFATQLLEASNSMRETEEAILKGEAALRVLNETATEADRELLGLTEAVDGASDSMSGAADSAEGFKDALADIRGFIPELSNELKRLKDEMDLRAAVGNLGFNNITPAVLGDIRRAQGAIADKYTNYEAVYTAQRGTAQGAEMERIVAGAARVAAQLGVSAKDILTAISYESNFRPGVMGGAGGQYYGLFQAGPAARERYGLTTSSGIEEQLDAMAKYLADAGVKAGDGLLQIYAAINAGSASRINASDANNGGMPGTVLDKVSGQMGGHAAKAEALLKTYAGIADEAEKSAAETKKKAEAAKEFHDQQALNNEQYQFELSLRDQDLIKQEQMKAIREAELAAKKAGTELTAAEREQILQNVELKYREQAAQEGVNAKKKAAQEAEDRVNQLLQQRQALMQQMQIYAAQGDTQNVAATKAEIDQVDMALQQATQNAIAMWEAIGGTEAQAKIATLRTAKLEAAALGQQANQNSISWQNFGNIIGNHLVNAFDEFAQAVANGEDVGEAFLRAFQKMAAQILIDIGKMILQQAIFNMLRGFGFNMGGGFGGAGAGVGLFHSGGIIGSGRNRTRTVDPAIFANAPRFHTGGFPGLSPNEVPIIAKKGEEMLTEDDPRNALNGGLNAAPAAAPQVNLKVVNALDSGQFVEEGMNTAVGEQAMINFMNRNRSSVKEALGV